MAADLTVLFCNEIITIVRKLTHLDELQNRVRPGVRHTHERIPL